VGGLTTGAEIAAAIADSGPAALGRFKIASWLARAKDDHDQHRMDRHQRRAL
jgi:hypothetical protein